MSILSPPDMNTPVTQLPACLEGTQGHHSSPPPPLATEPSRPQLSAEASPFVGVRGGHPGMQSLDLDSIRATVLTMPGLPSDLPVPPEALPFIGVLSDAEVSRIFSVPGKRVRNLRLCHSFPRPGAGNSRALLVCPVALREAIEQSLWRWKEALSSQGARTKAKIDPLAIVPAELRARGLPLIGVQPDGVVAAIMNVHTSRVSAYRKLHGIPHGTDLPGEVIPYLGVLFDYQIAERFNLSANLISAYRKAHGIPRPHGLPEEALPHIGVLSDVEVSRRFGISLAQISNYRNKRQIPKAKIRRSKIWTPERLALLGTMPDSDLAAQVGLSASRVAKLRRSYSIPAWMPASDLPSELVSLLGKETDYHLAEAFAIPRRRVFDERKRRGIPPAPTSQRHYKKTSRPLPCTTPGLGG